MKKLLLSALLSLAASSAFAQYQTPGTGVRWTLAQLAAATGSNVVLTSPGTYAVNGNLRLSPTDTLVIGTNATLRVAAAALVTVDGVLLVNPRDSVKITAQTSTAPFSGLTFSATSQGSRLRKTIVEYGGGIRVLDNDLLLDSCVVRYQVSRIGTTSTNSGAISPSGGAPRILNCRIYANARSGVLSPANRNTSPVIQNCVFRNNDTENGNYPQINLGIGGATPIVIERCQVIGGPYNMAGGVSVSNLLGTSGTTTVRIRQNRIANNRYGLALLGAGITATVTRNIIENNNINPNALTGGSGINLQGSATITGVASRNVLRGNLWGVTVLRTSTTSTTPGPTMSFGDVSSSDSLNVGLNQLYNNGNGGQVYDFYLNMPDNMLAQNNDWGTNSAAVAESHIVHQVDQAALGLLNFMPMRTTSVLAARPAAAALELAAYPNPVREALMLRLPASALASVSLHNALGQAVYVAETTPVNAQLAVPVGQLAPGLYVLTVSQQGRTVTAKVRVGE
ncbi:T9SS type A sorting domain-containing protein [Hymenobacter properus]|uniref:T9SS type A sorting domain-containing protein n=1 Tax=Hymenobacter properus TaxID=2791026 RepID=A0A931BK78_9BACT|nr:T9SS type A sorting domain-containing protein [Hymenobacter properus]MBF9143822.1 T9SS type A sorting domain-containing protein [Hymenobacter properus]MBR7722635.1 T9SS type A sorting domain-containing protein [Microvirga sp. SRT04]